MTRDERQEIARIKWIKNKCCGSLVQPTGAGKTVTALKCLKSVLSKYNNLKVLIVVPTDNLKIQWQLQLDQWGLLFNSTVEIINTVIKHDWNVDILVLDEEHRYASSCFSEVFNKVKYRYILGLTATLERLDGKHILIEKYCPVIDIITQQEALSNNWIAPFTEYQVLLEVDDISYYKKLNHDFVSNLEFFGFDFQLAMKMVGPKGYLNRIKFRDFLYKGNNPTEKSNVLKNITIHATGLMRALQARKAFINNHPKKLEITRKIIEAFSDRKIITFSNSIKMAESIGIGKVYTGKDNKKKSRISLDEFNSLDVGVINSSKKLIEGADIKGLSVAIMLGIDSSETRATQSRGRVIRFAPDKHALIFNLIINNTAETEWMKNSHKNSNYITITEQELDSVLKGNIPNQYTKKINELTFRF